MKEPKPQTKTPKSSTSTPKPSSKALGEVDLADRPRAGTRVGQETAMRIAEF